MKKKIVIFSGAGMSQESGLPIFRGDGGIWKSAVQAIREADMMIIVGCSLKVSPAAEMVEELREEAPLVVIDPADPPFPIKRTYSHLKLAASKGMKVMEETLIQKILLQ